MLLLILVPAALGASASSPIGGRFLIYDDTLVNETLPALAFNTQRYEFVVVWEAEILATGAATRSKRTAIWQIAPPMPPASISQPTAKTPIPSTPP